MKKFELNKERENIMKMLQKSAVMRGTDNMAVSYTHLFRNILEKGQKLLTFILYDVLVLKETPFKKSGSTSMPGELPELFPFPKK